MNQRIDVLTPNALRAWPLPSGAGSKYDRGTVVVVGGARRTPGAAMLAGLAALRVGAGRLSMAVAESVAIGVAVAVPESGVTGMRETPEGSVLGDNADRLFEDVSKADAVLIGSGLDHADETRALILALLPNLGKETAVVLDAYALGVLPEIADHLGPWRGRMVFTPNTGEAERLLEKAVGTLADDLPAIATRYGAVVTSFGVVAAPDGRTWDLGSGAGGLATSGSGDVLAGTIAGLLARGATPEQAACWGSYLHAAAGDRLAARIGPSGYLARELVDELPTVLAELGQRV
ncbi:MAG: NAD(P)H-hydrate dehydratase [Homoserinimonas sp.]|nr:NAD(P)H-hydrate dehydratase [Homoserinimonas sp.]